jgi:hypothetical protein
MYIFYNNQINLKEFSGVVLTLKGFLKEFSKLIVYDKTDVCVK